MIIEINKDYKINVDESHLTVKDKKLYNTKTKQYEGVEGDLVSFAFKTPDGKNGSFRGYVDGYTSDKKVKIRGIETTYTDIVDKKIEHISVVTDMTEGALVTAEETII